MELANSILIVISSDVAGLAFKNLKLAHKAVLINAQNRLCSTKKVNYFVSLICRVEVVLKFKSYLIYYQKIISFHFGEFDILHSHTYIYMLFMIVMVNFLSFIFNSKMISIYTYIKEW